MPTTLQGGPADGHQVVIQDAAPEYIVAELGQIPKPGGHGVVREHVYQRRRGVYVFAATRERPAFAY